MFDLLRNVRQLVSVDYCQTWWKQDEWSFSYLVDVHHPLLLNLLIPYCLYKVRGSVQHQVNLYRNIWRALMPFLTCRIVKIILSIEAPIVRCSVHLRLHYHGILSICQDFVHLMIIRTVLSQASGVTCRSLISLQIRVPVMRFPAHTETNVRGKGT